MKKFAVLLARSRQRRRGDRRLRFLEERRQHRAHIARARSCVNAQAACTPLHALEARHAASTLGCNEHGPARRGSAVAGTGSDVRLGEGLRAWAP